MTERATVRRKRKELRRPIIKPDLKEREVNTIGLNNDLLEIVGYYTVPSVTLNVMSVVAFIPGRTIYSQQFWKRKTIVIRSGLVFDDSILAKSPNPGAWYIYYRLVNRYEFGIPAILEREGDALIKLEPAPAISVSTENDLVVVAAPTGSRLYNLYKEAGTGKEIPEIVIKVIGLTDGVWALLTDRGRVLGVKVGEDKLVVSDYFFDNTVDISIGFDGDFVVLSRDGAATIAEFDGTGALKSTRRELAPEGGTFVAFNDGNAFRIYLKDGREYFRYRGFGDPRYELWQVGSNEGISLYGLLYILGTTPETPPVIRSVGYNDELVLQTLDGSLQVYRDTYREENSDEEDSEEKIPEFKFIRTTGIRVKLLDSSRSSDITRCVALY